MFSMGNNKDLPPLVTIVLAAYNGEPYLPQQLNSLFLQTYSNIEIVVLDDCSTDRTPEICARFAAMHSNMKVYQNEANLGYIKNFEKAIGLANGQYIALCDQDDIWHPDKIQTLMQYVTGASIVYCDSELIDEEGRSLNKNISDIKNLRDYNSPIPFIIANCALGHTMIMEKRFALSAMPFPSEFPHDWWLAFFASFNNGLKYIDKPLVQYRQHSLNIVGAVKTKATIKKKRKEDEVERTRARIRIFYERSTSSLAVKERAILAEIKSCYQKFSLINNFKRMLLFFRYPLELLQIKKRNAFRKWLFCFKMFVKVI